MDPERWTSCFIAKPSNQIACLFFFCFFLVINNIFWLHIINYIKYLSCFRCMWSHCCYDSKESRETIWQWSCPIIFFDFFQLFKKCCRTRYHWLFWRAWFLISPQIMWQLCGVSGASISIRRAICQCQHTAEGYYKSFNDIMLWRETFFFPLSQCQLFNRTTQWNL